MLSIRDLGNKVPCQHEETKTVITAGLRRTVCQRCSHVSVDFVEDVFEEERAQLGRHTR